MKRDSCIDCPHVRTAIRDDLAGRFKDYTCDHPDTKGNEDRWIGFLPTPLNNCPENGNVTDTTSTATASEENTAKKSDAKKATKKVANKQTKKKKPAKKSVSPTKVAQLQNEHYDAIRKAHQKSSRLRAAWSEIKEQEKDAKKKWEVAAVALEELIAKDPLQPELFDKSQTVDSRSTKDGAWKKLSVSEMLKHGITQSAVDKLVRPTSSKPPPAPSVSWSGPWRISKPMTRWRAPR